MVSCQAALVDFVRHLSSDLIDGAILFLVLHLKRWHICTHVDKGAPIKIQFSVNLGFLWADLTLAEAMFHAARTGFDRCVSMILRTLPS